MSGSGQGEKAAGRIRKKQKIEGEEKEVVKEENDEEVDDIAVLKEEVINDEDGASGEEA